MIAMLLIIAEQVLLHIPLMLGGFISFSLLRVPDLSLESAFVSGAFCASLVLPKLAGLPAVGSIIILLLTSVIGGALVGLTSGLLTRYAHMGHLLSSIVTVGIFFGINQFFAGTTYISLTGQLNPLMLDFIPRHPELVSLAVIGILVICFVYGIRRTQLGYALAVYGNNPAFFEHYGINGNYVFIVGLIISNALAGLSGYLSAQTTGFSEINMGIGKALLCITALILGKTIARRGMSASMLEPIIGCMIYFTLQQLLLKVGFNLKYFTTVQALVVLTILIISYRKTHKKIDNLGV
jgi:putative tryptophan/tyrosine transport system permease protein